MLQMKPHTLTEQNLHPLVQVSPISIMVAVAVPSSPPQHSPILGHLETDLNKAVFMYPLPHLLPILGHLEPDLINSNCRPLCPSINRY